MEGGGRRGLQLDRNLAALEEQAEVHLRESPKGEGWKGGRSSSRQDRQWRCGVKDSASDAQGAGYRAKDDRCHLGHTPSGSLTEARPSPTTQLLPGCRPRRDSRMRATSSSIGDEEDGGAVAASVMPLPPPPLPLGGAYRYAHRGPVAAFNQLTLLTFTEASMANACMTGERRVESGEQGVSAWVSRVAPVGQGEPMQPASLPGMHAGLVGGIVGSTTVEVGASWKQCVTVPNGRELGISSAVSWQSPTHEDVAKPRVKVARLLQVVGSWNASIVTHTEAASPRHGR